MEKLRAKVKSEVSKHIFGWYGETESAAGDSTRRNVEAFSKYRITPRYLRSDKSFSYPPNRGSLVQRTRRHPPKQPHPRFCRTLRSRQPIRQKIGRDLLRPRRDRCQRGLHPRPSDQIHPRKDLPCRRRQRLLFQSPPSQSKWRSAVLDVPDLSDR